MAGMVEWLTEQLDVRLTTEVGKLERTALAEQHLFLRVHQSGIPEQLLVNLSFEDHVPVELFPGHGQLTGIWIAADWGSGVLRWSAHDGWHRDIGWHDATFHDDADRD